MQSYVLTELRNEDEDVVPVKNPETTFSDSTSPAVVMAFLLLFSLLIISLLLWMVLYAM